MNYKKTGEVYFGDTFNRDSALNYCTSASATGAANVSGVCCSAVDSIVAYGENDDWTRKSVMCVDDLAINGSVASLSYSLEDLKDRLLALESAISNPKPRDIKTRNIFKTLQYKREVE